MSKRIALITRCLNEILHVSNISFGKKKYFKFSVVIIIYNATWKYLVTKTENTIIYHRQVIC